MCCLPLSAGSINAELSPVLVQSLLQQYQQNRGSIGVEKLGALDLATELTALEGQTFRARRITIEPGGVIAVHQHQRRPGFAYILKGEIIEHRNDYAEPIVRRAGDVAMEKTGVAHWWENKSGAPVEALVVDIVAESD